MGRNTRVPGLVKRGSVWHLDKRIRGYGRLCESTGESDLRQAELVVARRIDEIRQQVIFGVRPSCRFAEAAAKYLEENLHKRSIERDARALAPLVTDWVGDVEVRLLHMDTLRPYIRHELERGCKVGTVNRTLAVVRRILNLAARMWRHENGLPWLDTAPLITLLADGDARAPYPLDWDEQRTLFALLPAHLARMALFKVNTGTRESEVCGLRWEWERRIPELGTSVFVIPGRSVKNGQDRLIVLNATAQSVVERMRGQHPDFVFTYRGRGLRKMYGSAWKRVRRLAAERYGRTTGKDAPDGFRRVRVHDLKHTFGRRLRAAGVSFEDRQDLLGHKSARVTTHYSGPEIASLVAAANRVCGDDSRKSPALTVLRVVQGRASA